jgi:DNA-binding protein YbaB
MSTPLPEPGNLLSFLIDLERQLNFLDRIYPAQIVIEKRSADQKVRAVANGSGKLQSLTIDPSLLTGTTPVALAATVKDVINQALVAVEQQVASKIAHEAVGFSIAGLPAYNQIAPDFAGFSRTADAVLAKVLAANPMNPAVTFSCSVGPVTAVANATRQLTSLAFADPLPTIAPPLEDSTFEAVNCAIDNASAREDESNAVGRSILDASAAFSDLVVYAGGELKVDDHVVLRNAAGDGFGMVGNADVQQTSIGVEADVGNILSVGPVSLQTGARVHGFIRTAGQLTGASGAQVSGPIVESAVAVLPELTLNVVFPGTSQPGIDVGAGQQKTAGPDYYQSLAVRSQGQLSLSSGVYFCNSFLLESGGQASFNTSAGPVYLYVRDSFTFQGTFVDALGAVPNVFVGYLGTATTVIGASYVGTLVAPNAKIDVQPGSAPGHTAAFHGKQVEVRPNTTVRHLPFAISYEKLPNLAPPAAPVDATVHLGFEDISGWTALQAQIASATSPVTQGTRSLQVSNIVGPAEILGSLFSTMNVNVPNGRLQLDVWVSPNQPNPTSVGQLQVFATVPGAAVYGGTVGSAVLTNLPRGAWSTIDLAIPATTLQAIRDHRNTQLKIVLSVTVGSGPYYLDNIRFA